MSEVIIPFVFELLRSIYHQALRTVVIRRDRSVNYEKRRKSIRGAEKSRVIPFLPQHMETTFESDDLHMGIKVDNIVYRDRFVTLSDESLKLAGFHVSSSRAGGTKSSESQISPT